MVTQDRIQDATSSFSHNKTSTTKSIAGYKTLRLEQFLM
jgi:hypothetical protein